MATMTVAPIVSDFAYGPQPHTSICTNVMDVQQQLHQLQQLQQMRMQQTMAMAAASAQMPQISHMPQMPQSHLQMGQMPVTAATPPAPMIPQGDPLMTQGFPFYCQHMQQVPAPLLPAALSNEWTVDVSVEGMKFQYQLTDDDLLHVFGRYGTVKKVSVDGVGAKAQVTYALQQAGQAAIQDLSGKVLSGIDGTLRVSWAQQPVLPMPPPIPLAPATFTPAVMTSSCGWPLSYSGVPAWSPTSAAVPVGSTNASQGASLPPLSSAPVAINSTNMYACRFIIGIEHEEHFQVAQKILGLKGANMKRIARQTEAKIRLRGADPGMSGEGARPRDTSEPLQLCLSCPTPESYQAAVRQVEDLLQGVYNEYRIFCRDQGKPELELHPLAQEALPSQLGSGDSSDNEVDGEEDEGADGASPKREGRKRGRRSRPRRSAPADRGSPSPLAPPVEEIERCIDARNEARRQCNFAEADKIRLSLSEKGVALMDEPGGRGKGKEVTTWRYWRD